ncbi:hypothetical protein NEUTE2DRAFT_60429 [Neurospora tetrasperma FGSC 2509]|nr:hypothetical protein NEUTE2DRAFT_60429 [Neurospora tetrasperma FGSC 2509]
MYRKTKKMRKIMIKPKAYHRKPQPHLVKVHVESIHLAFKGILSMSPRPGLICRLSISRGYAGNLADKEDSSVAEYYLIRVPLPGCRLLTSAVVVIPSIYCVLVWVRDKKVPVPLLIETFKDTGLLYPRSLMLP